MDFDSDDVRRFGLMPGDVLVCEGGEVGRAAIWTAQLKECYYQKALHRVRTSDALSPSFLRYLLEHYARTRAFERYTSGTTISHLPQEDLRNLPLLLPPRPEQERIVLAIEEQFSRLDAGVAALVRTQQNLNRLRSAVLRDELEHQDAPRVEVGQLTTTIQYGYTAKAHLTGNGPKMLRITDIQDGSVNWGTVPYCVIGEDDAEKFRLAPGDLVFARSGATVGKSFLVDDVPDAVFASYLIRLRLREGVLPGYVALCFQSQDYWAQISRGSRGIGQPNVNATTLAKIKISLPDIQGQERALNVLGELDAVIGRGTAALDKQSRRAESMRSAILAAAFAGALVPQDPSDEPATVLLRRIAADRASSTDRKATRASKPRASQTNAGAQEQHALRTGIQLMWEDGYSMVEIADTMEISATQVGNEIARMRKEGWDVPYRRRKATA